jgi:outer membrane protein TolC
MSKSLSRSRLLAGSLGLLVSVTAAPCVTEDEFIARFGEDHPALHALMEGMARAEAARKRAAVLPNPRLEIWREAPDDNPRVTNWTVAWTPPLDGRYGLARQAADAGLAAEQQRLVQEKASLRSEARRIFQEWSLAFERRQVLARHLALVERLAGQERERARQGEASGLSARRLLLAAGEVRMSLASAEADYERTNARARVWRDDLEAGDEPARAQLPDPPGRLPAGELPVVRALEAEAAQAGLASRRADRFWGFPTLQAGWQTLDDGASDAGGPIIATSWSVPVFDRNQAERVETDRRAGILDAQTKLARARSQAELEGGIEAYARLHASARDAFQTAGEADAVIEASAGAYRAGEEGLTDLLEALRAAFAARLREIDAREEALSLHRSLEALMGRPFGAGGGS